MTLSPPTRPLPGLLSLWAGAATLAAPAIRLGLRTRARAGKEITERLPERRGIDATPRPAGRLLWLHAASVGETVSVIPVLAALAMASEATMLLTTGTVTSARLLARRLPELGLDGRVLHRFVPLDVPAWIRRFLDHWRPDAVGFVESELWPNLIAACRVRRIPAMLLNARLSARSFARWQTLPCTARALLAGFARVEAQSDADAARFCMLGARRVSSPGNLKFAAPALPADPTELARLQALLGDRPVWLAASTHPEEDGLLLDAHQRLVARHPGLLTIVAPRHPERGGEIAARAGALPVARRAAGQDPPATGVWIADTLGELGLLYRLAPAALLGRSLVPPGGGQNPLEAARLGCAVAVGPHTANFNEIVAALREAGALTEVADAPALAEWVGRMIDDPARRAEAGRAGIEAAERHADLPGRMARALLDLAAD